MYKNYCDGHYEIWLQLQLENLRHGLDLMFLKHDSLSIQLHLQKAPGLPQYSSVFPNVGN